MPNGTEPGSLIADTEDVYRAILYPHWWVEEKNRPSSAAFDEAIFSVDVKSKTTPQETSARFRNVTRLAEFNCGRAREIDFETRDELDPNQPDNLAHARVHFRGYDSFNVNQRKKKARKRAELCLEVVVPTSSSEAGFVQGVASFPSSPERQEVGSALSLLPQNPVVLDADDRHDVSGYISGHRVWVLVVLAFLVLVLLWVISR